MLDYRGYLIENVSDVFVANKKGENTITDPDRIGIMRSIDEYIETSKKAVMDIFTATGIAEGFIESENDEQVLEAWQHLHDTGTAYQLQGWFGRTAQSLIADGLISA